MAIGLLVVGPGVSAVRADEGGKPDLVVNKVIYTEHCDVGVLHIAVQVRNVGLSGSDGFATVLKVNGETIGLPQFSPPPGPNQIHKSHWTYSPFFGGELADQERVDRYNQVPESNELNNTGSHLTDFAPC